jgi:hypothetical protein
MNNSISFLIFNNLDYLIITPFISFFVFNSFFNLINLDFSRPKVFLYTQYLTIPAIAIVVTMFLMEGDFGLKLTRLLIFFPFSPMLLLTVYLVILGNFKENTRSLIYFSLTMNLAGQIWLSYISRTFG